MSLPSCQGFYHSIKENINANSSSSVGILGFKHVNVFWSNPGFLNKALIEAQQYDVEEQTREMLKNFPKLTITEIASQLKLDHAHFSRHYRTRATEPLTKAFLRIIDRSN